MIHCNKEEDVIEYCYKYNLGLYKTKKYIKKVYEFINYINVPTCTHMYKVPNPHINMFNARRHCSST